MDERVLFIVGDQYRAFAANSHVITESEFFERGGLHGAGPDARIVLGQGVSEPPRWLAMAGGRVVVEGPDAAAGLGVTHKRDVRHVLITEPRKVGPRRYEVALLVGDMNDRLVDHVTGQHVSGMVLVEAARQASTAATELEFIAPSAEQFGFIWNGLQVNFLRFAFPLPTAIQVELEKQEVERSQPKYVSHVTLTQAGHCVCEMTMSFGLLKSTTLSGLEAKAARRAVEAERAVRVHPSAQEEPIAVAAES